MPRRFLANLTTAWALSLGVAATAAEMHAPEQADPDLVRLSTLVRDILLATVPPEYENTKSWGGTKEVWDGLKVSVDGLRIKTKRRKKNVNHGTWKKYSAWLVKPRDNLHVELSELHERDDGRIEFVLTVRTPLGATGRLSEWVRDVQLYSFSINAQGYLSLRMRCDMALALNFQHLPPDLLLDPVVSDAEIRLVDFRVTRISDLSGPLVHELGKNLHRILQDELHQRRDEIVRDMNEQIDKHRQHMRLSLYELLQWDKVQELIEQEGEAQPAASLSSSSG